MSQRQDPFNQYTGAPTTNVQPNPVPAQQFTMITQINEPSLQAVREIVREEVQKAMVEMVEMINKIKAHTGARF